MRRRLIVILVSLGLTGIMLAPLGTNAQAPLGVTPDNTLIVSVASSERAPHEDEGLWRLGIDGSEPTHLLTNGASYPADSLAPIALSADGRYVSLVSIEALARMDMERAFHLADLKTGETWPVEIDGSRYVLGPPLFSPVAAIGLLQGGLNPAVAIYVMSLETGKTSPVVGSQDVPINWFRTPPTWAENNTVFIPTDQGGMLLTLEHAA